MTWEKILLRLLWVLPLTYLNWAALHDIARGESNVWMEWTILVLTATALIFAMFRRVRHRKTAVG